MKLVGDLKYLAQSQGFLKLLGVRLVSQCANGLFQAGLATLFFFNPYRSADVNGVALALVVMLLPFSIIGPFTGPFIDRWSRRNILMWGNALCGGITLLIIGAVAGNIMWAQYVLALTGLGITRIMLSTLSASLPVVLRSKERLLVANSLVPTLGGVSTVVGAVLGILLRLVLPTPAAQNLGSLALALVIYLISVWVVKAWFAERALGPETVKGGSFGHALAEAARDLGEGLRYLWRRGTPSAALTTMSLHRFVYGMEFITLILAARNLYTEPTDADHGLALASTLFGAILLGHAVSIVLTPIAHERIAPYQWILICLVGGTAGQLILALTTNFTAVMAGLFIFGIGVQGAKIAVDTIVQSDTADAFRGRAFSIYDVLFNVAECVAAGVCVAVLPTVGLSRPVQMVLVVFVWAVAAGYYAHIRALRNVPRAVLPEEYDAARAASTLA
ncbi:MFS transporter [Neoactinobaculum massilliense]|uniref:MFS transporter n=1 Tax=Neoactinobaculum massilliense TaxID=2364794 RepID=UPI000F54BCB0|nr:MFS transporter [Neoactinobaculum massilliense]